MFRKKNYVKNLLSFQFGNKMQTLNGHKVKKKHRLMLCKLECVLNIFVGVYIYKRMYVV